MSNGVFESHPELLHQKAGHVSKLQENFLELKKKIETIGQELLNDYYSKDAVEIYRQLVDYSTFLNDVAAKIGEYSTILSTSANRVLATEEENISRTNIYG